MKVCGIDWYQSWNESLKSHTRTTCAQFCNYVLSCSPSASSTVIILSHLSHNRRKQTVYCPRLLDYVFNDDKEPWTWYAIHPPPLSSSWSTIVTLYCSWYTTIFFFSWASISLIFGSLSCSQLLDNLGEADMVWMIHDYWAKLLRTYKCLLTGTIRVFQFRFKEVIRDNTLLHWNA